MTEPTRPHPRPDAERRRLVVVGGGMVAHRLVEALVERDADGRWEVDLVTEEPRAPYDRVALTSYFSGRDAADLALGDPALWQHAAVRLHRAEQVLTVDRATRTATTSAGRVLPYDALVLATGSRPFVPPVQGITAAGVFTYRTVDDVAALRGWVEERREEGRPLSGLVVGGGLLGLEAAGALQAMDVATTVVESAPRLMPLQVDEGGGEALRRLVERLGVRVRPGTATERFSSPGDRVRRAHLSDGSALEVDVVVVATGVRPRDELAREIGLPTGDRGGVVVDEACRTADPHVWAVGEVACVGGRTYGIVAPGYAMAEVVADRLLGGAATVPDPDTATKLKLLGVDVASFGEVPTSVPASLEVVYADPVAGVYKKLVLSDDAQVLLGGVLVGDASAYASLRPLVGRPLGTDPHAWLLPGGVVPVSGGDLPDDASVCTCQRVSAGAIRKAVREGGCGDVAAVKACTRAGTSCGSCVPLVKRLVDAELEASGVEVPRGLCEHVPLTRAEVFEVLLVSGIRSFTAFVERYGSGRGCDVCKPVVASVLSSLGRGHVLDGENAALQDTNDHVMANMQRDGTYSVVPRVPGGEITPEGLITIGEVARDFGLYTKITGAQRVDMFGARIEQLPPIWARLVAAGFESGHAYGKALRTVKSCVGSTWCRYGLHDSVGLAVALELRYRGLRSPHKLKLGVSGCARECAEARGKDVGIIATEKGWDLYVGGNGGFTPRHAQLFAQGLSTGELVKAIDRFLVYYVRTADRLQRTATWIEQVEGGLDHVRAVVLEDSLGMAADLDAAMAEHVDGYVDEWRATLEDPEKLRRFASFVNAAGTPDPSLAYVEERGQRRPALDAGGEPTGTTLVAGPVLRVGAP